MEKIQRGNKLKKLLTDENVILLKIYCVTQTNTSEKRKIVTTLGYNKHQNDLDWKKRYQEEQRYSKAMNDGQEKPEKVYHKSTKKYE